MSLYSPITSKDKEILKLANRLKQNNLNLNGSKINPMDFSKKIQDISKMIDHLAKQRSKVRNSQRRKAKSVAR